eukprot:CAMPEP_0172822954 /NCGR_PEP_ID=MMETSP1075-20121228/16994_1 /TAXON_ID=2916 /ORGANISM="Ceratium fusus, Strain PA161109" /LENGTH=55 /DNA_ID=CAMNT_0013664007 /DNA_START=1 /DNA_END=165 /DNA_ORIENTATION=+
MSSGPLSRSSAAQACLLLLLCTLKVQTTGQNVQLAPLLKPGSGGAAVDQEETPES